MAFPDIGLPPPPPPDVSAQLRPSVGGPAPGAGPAPNLQQILAGLGGNQPPPLQANLTPEILAVEPLLDQIARQVPALGPDVDRLNVELQSRMGGLPTALAGMASPLPGSPPPGIGGTAAPGAAPGGPPPVNGSPASPVLSGPIGAPASIPVPTTPAGPAAAPAPATGGVPPPAIPAVNPQAGPGAVPTPPTGGAMDTAMQLETQLPQLGKDDPTLMPYIQGFIARMREEVPKVVNGETETTTPPQQAAPTESMLSKIPVTY